MKNHAGRNGAAGLSALFSAVLLLSCVKEQGTAVPEGKQETVADEVAGAETAFRQFLDDVTAATELPSGMARRIAESAEASPAFILETLECLGGQPDLFRLVDKTHALPGGFVPADLVELGGADRSYRTTRAGLKLRRDAAAALEEMAAAARRDGVVLTAGSAYRSYEYQVEVYARIVEELGEEQADRESARPGFSQHQTGLVVDFYPIDDGFAATPAGRWMRENAAAFGWSLSFPEGYEQATGYRHESWHYRYLGKTLAAYTESYFGGVQQYALRFLREWLELSAGK